MAKKRSPGRPIKHPEGRAASRIMVNLPKPLYNKLKAQAKKNDGTITEAIVAAVREYVA